MPAHNTTEEKQLLKLINQMPITDEDKTRWGDTITESGFSEELADEVRQKVASLEGNEKTRYLVEWANLVRRWRLSNQAKHFRKH